MPHTTHPCTQYLPIYMSWMHARIVYHDRHYLIMCKVHNQHSTFLGHESCTAMILAQSIASNKIFLEHMNIQVSYSCMHILIHHVDIYSTLHWDSDVFHYKKETAYLYWCNCSSMSFCMSFSLFLLLSITIQHYFQLAIFHELQRPSMFLRFKITIK